MPGVETFSLAPDLKICRILNGMWQVSGAHGHIEPYSAVNEMVSYHDAGLTSWDMADIYGPAEDFFGEFRRRLAIGRGEAELSQVVGLTKFVPSPGPMQRKVVEQSIDRSMGRMGVSQIDAVQFHWWDYADKRYLDAMRNLSELRDEGKVKHLALTNFDTLRMQEMADSGLDFVSNQVQYSIIDQRPEIKMTGFCKQNGVSMLAYGTLAGGLLSEKFLGVPEPPFGDLNTASLQKYRHMLDLWGDWDLLQELLGLLDTIAKKHNVGISNVATRYILDKQCVAGVIIGTRLGMSEHIKENLRTFGFQLDNEDTKSIDEFSRAGKIYRDIGDCGDEYR